MIYGYSRCSTNECTQDIERQGYEPKKKGVISNAKKLRYLQEAG